jgi:hypothetical protein
MRTVSRSPFGSTRQRPIRSRCCPNRPAVDTAATASE